MTSMLSLSHGDSTPSVQLFRSKMFTNPDQWDENAIQTGVEDALTKWKDSVKE